MKISYCLIFIILSANSFSQIVKDSVNKKKLLDKKNFLLLNKKIIDDSLKIIENKLDKFKPIKYWKINGSNSLIVNQNYFSNWFTSNENNLGFSLKLNYDINYKKNKSILENKISIGYAGTSNKNNGFRKNEDKISFSSTYGRIISKKLYLSANITLNSQFFKGYDYGTINTKNSNIFAPAYLDTGIGLEYKLNDKLQVYFRPASTKTTLILDEDLQIKGKFGLKNNGDNYLIYFGKYSGFRYKSKINNNIEFDNNAGLFINYLYKTKNIDLFYNFLMNIKLNKWINAQIAFDFLYDHDQLKKAQFKQNLGFGFLYTLSK